MKKLLLSLTLLLLTLSTFAVPAYRGWQTKTQPDGTSIEVRLIGDEFYHYWQDQAGNVVKCDSLGYWRVVESQLTPATIKARRQASAMLQSRPKKAVGSVNLAPRGLVILVNFKDVSFNAANTQSAMNDLMNADSYTYNDATGSVRKYFSDQSDGQYTPQFDVVGPVTLPNYMAYYGGNDANGDDKLPGDMIVEACSIANALHNVDFTQYDNDSDGYVDFVYLIYAGKGEADGGAANTIWPHSWDVYSAAASGYASFNKSQYYARATFDGKRVLNYACSGEIDGQTGARAGIGTIVHEYSHVIGLPDLYDIDYGQNYEDEATPGAWHVMDGGSYNNDGNTPPNYSIYDKYFLRWKTPTNLGATAQNLSLKAAGTDGYNAYQITSDNSLLAATSTTTAYYIENRQQSGWDKHLPGHGLVIWKIMYNQSVWNDNAPNATLGTIRYAVVSASGATTGIGTAADPFPGTKKVTRWEGVTNKPLLNITEKNGIISLSYIEEVDESICSYEVAYENATVSSESGEIAKGGTLTLTVTPHSGYVLDNTMIEVDQNGVERNFTYSGTTLTISNVQGDIEIYIIPEEQSNTFRVTWIANGEVLTDANATHAYTSGDALLMPSTEVNACSGMEFVGWTAIKDYQNPFCPPADLFDSAEGKTVTQNIIYYAVYKK
ncbi:MAG: M6 family metalloprotease domain-containing protein [Paludibacteraceae bacterium]|nr:M6 family metalloprotease domain-containing protein [Paludibacteraceae bacterium]